MLLRRTQETLNRIGNSRLQLPIFYESRVALRFEIGDPELELSVTKEALNPAYFRAAYLRADALYREMKPFDVLLWVLYRSSEDSAEPTEILEKFRRLTALPAPAEAYSQDTVDADGDPLTRIFLFWDLKQEAFEKASLLEGILHADFGGFAELSSAVFFFDTDRHLLYHLYDDRGLDIVAEQKEDIAFLHKKYTNWLLDYDRKRMDDIFGREAAPNE